MTSIKLGGREFALEMSALAVSQYRKLTGLNLMGGKHTIFDILGWGKDREFDPDLFCKFLYACMVDGFHPEKPNFTLDDVYKWVKVYDKNIAKECYELYMTNTTGKTMEEVNKDLEEAIKNLRPPAEGAN